MLIRVHMIRYHTNISFCYNNNIHLLFFFHICFTFCLFLSLFLFFLLHMKTTHDWRWKSMRTPSVSHVPNTLLVDVMKRMHEVVKFEAVSMHHELYSLILCATRASASTHTGLNLAEFSFKCLSSPVWNGSFGRHLQRGFEIRWHIKTIIQRMRQPINQVFSDNSSFGRKRL